MEKQLRAEYQRAEDWLGPADVIDENYDEKY